MIALTDHLSIGTLMRTFWGRITLTWGLTLIETALFALLPLLIGQSIDGLLNDDWTPFGYLMTVLGALLIVATGRRVYDTRAYGTMRVELGKAQAERGKSDPVSVVSFCTFKAIRAKPTRLVKVCSRSWMKRAERPNFASMWRTQSRQI